MIKNMTPHPVTMCDEAGNIVRSFPSDGVIRLQTQIQYVGTLDGVRITRTVFSAEALPPAQEGVYFIVSQMVKNSCPNRVDFLVPTEMVRDENGQIVGCKSLGC